MSVILAVCFGRIVILFSCSLAGLKAGLSLTWNFFLKKVYYIIRWYIEVYMAESASGLNIQKNTRWGIESLVILQSKTFGNSSGCDCKLIYYEQNVFFYRPLEKQWNRSDRDDTLRTNQTGTSWRPRTFAVLALCKGVSRERLSEIARDNLYWKTLVSTCLLT